MAANIRLKTYYNNDLGVLNTKLYYSENYREPYKQK